MWLFTKYGMLSIVANQNPEAPPYLVRARRRQALVWALTAAEKINPRGREIMATPGADYPYRTALLKTELASLMDRALHDVTYPNFKKVAETVGAYGKHGGEALMDVWSAMLRTEDAEARPPYVRPSRAAKISEAQKDARKR